MTKQNDEKLRELLAQVIDLAKNHGTRSEEVKQFVRDNKDVEEFPELAATCILIIEDGLPTDNDGNT
jgi:hypothetical protein